METAVEWKYKTLIYIFWGRKKGIDIKNGATSFICESSRLV
jgi:hypothetical protein